MRVTEAHVARVVTEVSSGASDPNHTASLVGAFMQRQPTVGHYVLAHRSDVGAEGTVLTLLHAAVVARCIEVASGRPLRPLAPRDLDAAARSPGGSADALAKEEPQLVAYVEGNVTAEDPTLGGKKRPIALELLRTITRALLDQAS
jgi:hypothetical protein